MPDDNQAGPVASFITALNKAWTAAGPPSFAELERLSKKFTRPVESSGLMVMMLAASTTHEILTGQRRSLPRWQWVASFVTVLRVAAAQAGVNPENIGTLQGWKTMHEAADAAQRAANEIAHEAVKEATSVTPSTVGHQELARVAPPSGVAGSSGINGDRRDAQRTSVLTLAKRASTLGWWHDYRDVVPDWFEAYLSLEPAAHLIRAYEPRFVPGLLQTQEYAETVIRLVHDGAPAAEIERRVELRMRRQRILSRPNPPQLWVLIDEEALCRPLGDAATMRAQIEHLLAVSAQPHVTVQVMPPRSGNRMTPDDGGVAGGAITVLRFVENELPDVVYLEQLNSALYPDTSDDFHHYGMVFARLAIEAEKPATTVDVLREILKRL